MAQFGAQGQNPAVASYPGTVSRDAAAAGVEYLADPRVKASARLELRYDNADDRLVGAQPGVADRIQLVALSGAEWKWTDDLAFLAKFHLATTENDSRGITDARWVEASLALSYRPVQYDTVAALFKYTRLLDLRPLDLATGLHDEVVADVLAISPTLELPFRLGIAQKLAYKHSRLSADGLPAASADTVLSVSRLDFHLLPELDLSGEYRVLWVGLPRENGGSRDLRHGAVAEIAWRPFRYFRVGLGYDLSRISDDELHRTGKTEGGVFMRVTGVY